MKERFSQSYANETLSCADLPCENNVNKRTIEQLN